MDNLEKEEYDPFKEENNKDSLEEIEYTRVFRPFKIKDIVFLAIISAITLCTGAVMPLVSNVPIFGIIQVVLGFQFSFFPSIGLSKVRKPGSLLFIAIFSGIVLVFMNSIMFFCLLICALIAEMVGILVSKGYKNNLGVFLTSFLYLPLTLPFLYVWYKIIGGEDSVATYFNDNVWLSIIMIFCVLIICAVGSILGIKVSKELKKAGALKK